MKFKILFISVIILFSLTSCGLAYSRWTDKVTIIGSVTTGHWEEGGCFRIMKTLDGSFTNATTGEDLEQRTDLIHIGNRNPPNFPTKFNMSICIQNCGNTTLSDIVVTDRLENQFGPINWTADRGTASWVSLPGPGNFSKDYLRWEVGELKEGEQACLHIWIQTLQNPVGFYEPTSPGNYMVNTGAYAVAYSDGKLISAKTEAIEIEISQGTDNIARILTALPYSTPWATSN